MDDTAPCRLTISSRNAGSNVDTTGKRKGPLGDVLGVIGRALQIDRDVLDGEHQAKIGCDGPVARQHLQGARHQLVLLRIHFQVGLDQFPGLGDILIEKHRPATRHHAADMIAHALDARHQLAQRLIERRQSVRIEAGRIGGET